MEKSLSNFSNCSYLTNLSEDDLFSINGGSGFWEDLAFVAGATAKCIYVFAKTAVEYQHSLPANLKK